LEFFTAKQKISAKAVAADIKSGMDDVELMKKYELSVRGLEILFQKLIENHLVTAAEIFAVRHVSSNPDRPEIQTHPDEPPGDSTQVLEVARQQKRLIWLILLELIVGILLIVNTSPMTTGPSAFTEAWAVLRTVVSLTLAIICAYFVYKIGRALKISTLWLVITIILLFVPLISLGALLYMNDQATRLLRAAGVKVGLMGAKRKSLARMLDYQ
jgi:hypothetical protein